MAKRERAEIDEDAIRRMMSGDIPRREPSLPQVTPAADEPPEDIGPKSLQTRPKKRSADKDYAELFLHKRTTVPKRQTYVE